MQRETTTRPVSTPPVRPQQARQGGKPVPLDPKDLLAVSGGLPKGTWAAAAGCDDPSLLPKGTW
ncbi:MAG: hypothetical protein AMXMBFR66_07110 [Pseudomonadota bacterium]|nr:hypothetical protein [Rubrivivax sp.]